MNSMPMQHVLNAPSHGRTRVRESAGRLITWSKLAAIGSLLAGAAHAQTVDFESPPVGAGESGTTCTYAGVAPTVCAQNDNSNIYGSIDATTTVAFRSDGERICGKTDAPAHSGNCYVSLLRNPGGTDLPTLPWDGTFNRGNLDQQGQVFSTAYIGTGDRSISVYSRANQFPRYTTYVGGHGLIRMYSRDTTAGTSGWTLLGTQICTNTTAWARCTLNFTIPPAAQQVAFLLAPAAILAGDALSVDFDDVELSKLRPVIAAADDSFTAPAAGTTTASVTLNDTIAGQAAVSGINVILNPGTAPATAAGSISMAADGTVVVAPGTTAGSYAYPYEICAQPALVPPLCASAIATIVVTAAPVIPPVDPAPVPVPTLGQWALLLLGTLMGLLAFASQRRNTTRR